MSSPDPARVALRFAAVAFDEGLEAKAMSDMDKRLYKLMKQVRLCPEMQGRGFKFDFVPAAGVDSNARNAGDPATVFVRGKFTVGEAQVMAQAAVDALGCSGVRKGRSTWMCQLGGKTLGIQVMRNHIAFMADWEDYGL